MFIQAPQGQFIANPVVLGVIIILVVVVAIYWYATHCPNCKRIFTRELQKKERAGRLPSVITNKERRHYRCKRCGHQWDKVVEID